MKPCKAEDQMIGKWFDVPLRKEQYDYITMELCVLLSFPLKG